MRTSILALFALVAIAVASPDMGDGDCNTQACTSACMRDCRRSGGNDCASFCGNECALC
ncbi:hypothetical protein BC828DRAFT_406804 [Blastocladiella britannica]|nr:hypothetical protein BC828DRAFT_406804 [Blastocladiella britannica]